MVGWSIVVDGGPILAYYRVTVLCLLGWFANPSIPQNEINGDLIFRGFCQVKKIQKSDRGVGGCDPANPSFSRIFLFFLTWQDPLKRVII